MAAGRDKHSHGRSGLAGLVGLTDNSAKEECFIDITAPRCAGLNLDDISGMAATFDELSST